ncbi:glycosyltransferase [Spirosoma pomorum]
MRRPLISIIITVLNGEGTIAECIQSMKEQVFDDFEIVIVDGGSTDLTVNVIENFNLNNLVLDITPGISLYGGLNKGIGLSSGKWLYFMGCDDKLYNPFTLQSVAGYINAHTDSQVFVGNVLYRSKSVLFNPKLGKPHLLQYFVHHQGMFYDNNLFKDQSYDESLKIVADYKFNMSLAIKGVKHTRIDTVICNFSDEGVSNKRIRLGSDEMLQVNKTLFRGIVRLWVIFYGKLRQEVWIVRHKYGLIHLKDKLQVWFKLKKQIS